MHKLKIHYLTVLFGILMVICGCGGGDGTSVGADPSCTVSFEAAINPDGTATTGANTTSVVSALCNQGYMSGVSATLPPNTVITARNSDGSIKALTAPFSLKFTVPADSTATYSGTHGVPVPAGFAALASTAGAVDVQLTGAASATFNPPITITMPVPGKAVGERVAVFSVTGRTYTLLDAYTVTTAGFVSFPVSSLSWKVVNPNGDTGTSTTIATTVPGTTVATTVTGTTAATTIPGTTIATTVPATTVATTVPGTTVATTVSGTTVATTVPGTTVGTTVPGTTIATTVPGTTVATTVPPTTVATTTVATTTTTVAPTTVATTSTTTSTTTVEPIGLALYQNNCQRCHGPYTSPNPPIEKSVSETRAALMGQGLTDAELLAIFAILP